MNTTSPTSFRFTTVARELDTSEECMDALEVNERAGRTTPGDAGVLRYSAAACAALWTMMQASTRAERLAAVVALREARNQCRRDAERVNGYLLAGLTVWGGGRAPDTDAWGRSSRDFVAPAY